jgi:hypothetical protein
MTTPRRRDAVDSARRIRPWELLPEAALALGLGTFALLERGVVISALRSRRALVLMVVVAAAWIGARFLLARVRRFRIVRTLLFAVAAVGVLAVVVFPNYRNERVVEALPSDIAGAAVAAPVRTAMLVGIDHRAAGTAALYRAADGRHVVGLEDIDIQPGPDYDVYLVPGRDQRTPDAGVRLDDLRGNQGTQYYEVPGDAIKGDDPWTVLVWCEVFDVPIANATPA